MNRYTSDRIGSSEESIAQTRRPSQNGHKRSSRRNVQHLIRRLIRSWCMRVGFLFAGSRFLRKNGGRHSLQYWNERKSSRNRGPRSSIQRPIQALYRLLFCGYCDRLPGRLFQLSRLTPAEVDVPPPPNPKVSIEVHRRRQCSGCRILGAPKSSSPLRREKPGSRVRYRVERFRQSLLTLRREYMTKGPQPV